MDNKLPNIKPKRVGLNEKRLFLEKNNILQIERNKNVSKLISIDNKSKNNIYVNRPESLTVDTISGLQDKNNY